jgi:hypothetical protein
MRRTCEEFMCSDLIHYFTPCRQPPPTPRQLSAASPYRFIFSFRRASAIAFERIRRHAITHAMPHMPINTSASFLERFLHHATYAIDMFTLPPYAMSITLIC